MKKNLLKKFSAFIIIAMMFSATTHAQIVYTDVNPDQTITGTYNLDLNNDGVTDFVIAHSTANGICNTTSHYIRVTPSGSNQVADYATASATKMSINTLVSSATLTWSSTANQLMASYRNLTMKCIYPHWVGSGQWYNAVDGYLGLKLIKNGNTYYGWVRMSAITLAHGFIVKDYAFDSTPNHSILTGATSGARFAFVDGNETEQNNSVSIFPNPASDKITVNISSLTSKNADVKINDLMGKIVFSHQYNLEDGNASAEIDIADLSKGMYLIQIQNTEFLQTKKLFVTK